MISQKALGLIFLLVTSAAWIGASFITQALVSRGEEEPAALEPWLLTLICSSTLMLYLPVGHCARKRARYEGRTRAARSPRPRTRQRKGPPVGTSDDVAFEHATGCLHPRRRAAAAAAATATAADSMAAEADDPSEDDGTEHSDAEVGATGRGSRTSRGTEERTGSVRSSRGVERQPLLHGHTHTHTHTHKHQQHSGGNGGDGGVAGAAAIAGADADGGDGGGSGDGGEVETSQIVRAAFVVAPVWFAAQLAFTASLEFTSVTSNTVLSSCSSLFVYLGSLALGQEVSSALRFASVLAAMAGTSLVALGDRQHEEGGDEDNGTGGGTNPLFGDALTLLAAALYALYTIMMKRLLVKDDAIVMALFFGTIGVLYFAVLAPVAGALALAGAPVVRRVTSKALGLALVQGLIDYVAADYAWARAVMLLGPTATSCGLAMQIPAAGIIDAVINGSNLSWSESPGSMVQFLLGSVLIICGFVGVSLEPRVVASIWKRCTDCVGLSSGASGAGAGGAAAGNSLEAQDNMVVVDGLADGRVAAWEDMRGGGASASGVKADEAAGAGAGTSEESVGLLMADGEMRRGRRGSAGGVVVVGGWGGGGGGGAGDRGGGGGSATGKAGGRGFLRQMGLSGGAAGSHGNGGGGGGGGSGSAVDSATYIPFNSSTAGGSGGVHVVLGRSVPSAAAPDT